MPPRTATCTCGALRAICAEEPIRTSVCHCYACQRRTGSAFGVQARFDAAAVTLEGDATEFLRVGDGGARVTFRFCPTCGDTLSYTLDVFPDAVVIPVGAFGDRDFPAPTSSVYDARQHPWVELHGLLHRMD
ncbi:MAG: GFA family protein [Proteobacteria bacterium]|nr:GFA family protein [Pseudomonadota bacterium]